MTKEKANALIENLESHIDTLQFALADGADNSFGQISLALLGLYEKHHQLLGYIEGKA